MRYIFLIVLLFCQTFIYSQDKKVLKIAQYIEKGKLTDAKKLLDELDKKPEYQSDIFYWYVRAVFYRSIALNTSYPDDVAIAFEEGRKSYTKLEELNRLNPNSGLSQHLPTIKKDLYEGKNKYLESSSSNLVSSSKPNSDNGKIVTLTQIGQGKTKDIAKYDALRNAIEKAFGMFISSNTIVLKDELAKDEIISVTSGNIQSFEILSETQQPDGSFTNVVKATVSIGKLTKFCESKGIAVEFKGGLFAANIKLQEINKANEEAAMDYAFKLSKTIIASGIWDYKLQVGTPQKNSSSWNVPITVEENLNYSKLEEVRNIINGLSLSPEEIETYKEVNQEFYKINGKYLRSRRSVAQILYLSAYLIPSSSRFFKVTNGIETFNFTSLRCQSENNYAELTTNNSESVSKIFFRGCKGCGYDNNLCGYIHEYDYYTSSYSYSDERWLNEFSYERSWIERGFNGYYVDERRCFYLGDKTKSFTFEFNNILSTEQISKISEYKVAPLK